MSESPRQMGPYSLIRPLGEGGMGEVWIARRTLAEGASKSVAVKILSALRANSETHRRMFYDEARLSMLLSNSNIVQVFDVGEEGGACYMAMEWVEGLNLDELRSALRGVGQQLPLTVVGYVVGEILKALAYAHDLRHEGVHRTIVHRDVSAHNVMLSVSGEVKLMDFGIARVASEETSGMHVKGKLRYMPPEQLRGDSREPTIDLFAVGAILHELMDGERFRSRVVDEARLYGMVLDGEVPPLACPRARAPAGLETLRRRLLQARPADRFQTARDAYECLSRWSGYGDAKFELQDLVREFVGAEGSRPGTSGRRQMSESAVSPTSAHSSSGSATGVKPPRSRTRARPAARTSSIPVGLVLAAIGVGVAVFGVGAVLANRGRARSEVIEPSSQAVDQAKERSPESVGEPEIGEAEADDARREEEHGQAVPEEAVVAVAEEAVVPAPEEAVVPAPEEAVVPAPEEAVVPPVVTRVPVTFTAPGRFWVEIKVGGRAHEISRMKGGRAKVRLRPGQYVIMFREEPRGPWRSGGVVTVGGEGARIELRASGRFVTK